MCNTLRLTISIFQGLFLLGGFRDDLDPLAEEDSYVGAVSVKHLHRQHEVLSFIRVTDIQRLCCAEVLTQRVGGWETDTDQGILCEGECFCLSSFTSLLSHSVHTSSLGV